MKIITVESYEKLSEMAAEIICNQVNSKPESILGLATGSSPVGAYKKMAELNKEGKVDFSKVISVNLDEYVGLSKDNVNSYYYFMQDNLFGKTDVNPEKINFLSGEAENLEEECQRYYNRIKECGGIDIQLLGIGTNGHIGFNEPGDKFKDIPFPVKLTQSTIDSNRKYFEAVGDTMPEYALTMGIGDIMRSRKIILIATGESKAKAVKELVEGEVSPSCPATILQMHADVTIFLDKAAASLLGEKK